MLLRDAHGLASLSASRYAWPSPSLLNRRSVSKAPAKVRPEWVAGGMGFQSVGEARKDRDGSINARPATFRAHSADSADLCEPRPPCCISRHFRCRPRQSRAGPRDRQRKGSAGDGRVQRRAQGGCAEALCAGAFRLPQPRLKSHCCWCALRSLRGVVPRLAKKRWGIAWSCRSPCASLASCLIPLPVDVETEVRMSARTCVCQYGSVPIILNPEPSSHGVMTHNVMLLSKQPPKRHCGDVLAVSGHGPRTAFRWRLRLIISVL